MLNELGLNKRLTIGLSIIYLSLMIVANGAGAFFTEWVYPVATPYYLAALVPQDYANLLFIMPLFIISIFLMFKGSKVGFILYSGILLFYSYISFTYCFTIAANHLFLVYIILLGLSIYQTGILLITIKQNVFSSWFSEKGEKRFFIYLLVVGIFFITYWLVTSMPIVIFGKLAESEVRSGFNTSPFHIFDLGIFFPLFIISAFLIRKGNSYGHLLGSMMLIFTLVMSSSLFMEMIFIYLSGQGLELPFLTLFGLLAFISLWMTLSNFKRIRN